MSSLISKGNWNIAKGKLKQMVARLTQDDVQFIEGKTDELVGRIQKRAGTHRQQIERNAQMVDENGFGHH